MYIYVYIYTYAYHSEAYFVNDKLSHHVQLTHEPKLDRGMKVLRTS